MPVFTYYLSPELSVDDVVNAWNEELIVGIKYYPKGGTTASDKGLEGFQDVYPILEVMQKHRIPLLIHGETPVYNNTMVDDYEREEKFLETEMTALRQAFPELLIVLEHITTSTAAQFALAYKDHTCATITPQHLLLDRRALYNGVSFQEGRLYYHSSQNGMKPDMMCRPILKHQRHVQGLQDAVRIQHANGYEVFGLGTDTAPHEKHKKYCECGMCGVFSAPIALELYAAAFEEMDILEHLSVFACDVMPAFYHLKDKLPKKTIVLERKPLLVAPDYDNIVTPFAGETIPWTARVRGGTGVNP